MTSFIEFYKKDIHENAVKKGFWNKPVNIPEKLMLTVSEVSEALEALRDENFCKNADVESLYEMALPEGMQDKKLFKDLFEQKIKNTFQDEIADSIIRLLDICHYYNIDIERQLAIKHEYNKLRPFKHNRKF